jgi:hypothetical protein
MEEAGVVGRIDHVPIAEFTTTKHGADGTAQIIRVRAFALAVVSELLRWPEDHQRERRWLPLKRAISTVEDPAIRKVLRLFADAHRATPPSP